MSGKKIVVKKKKKKLKLEHSREEYYCHHGDVYVFNLGDTEIYAGGLIRGSTGAEMDLIIELAECRVPVATVGLQCLKRFKRGQEYLYLPIDDGTAPNWSREFWVELMEEIQFFKKVLVRCLGGHGRTGTVLAIFAGLSGVDYPCKYVRERYCKKAVEKLVQAKYVKRITKCSGTCGGCIEFERFEFKRFEFSRKGGGEYEWNGEWREV